MICSPYCYVCLQWYVFVAGWVVWVPDTWLSLFVGEQENEGNPVQSKTNTQFLSQQEGNTGNGLHTECIPGSVFSYSFWAGRDEFQTWTPFSVHVHIIMLMFLTSLTDQLGTGIFYIKQCDLIVHAGLRFRETAAVWDLIQESTYKAKFVCVLIYPFILHVQRYCATIYITTLKRVSLCPFFLWSMTLCLCVCLCATV